MKLIADSGSTKTTWYLDLPNGSEENIFYTLGYNPHFIDTEGIIESLQEQLIPVLGEYANAITEIYFYGAGCSTERECNTVAHALKAVFKNLEICDIEHDLLGAARALCGRKSGIACILGTGSNSCLYDGKDITDNVTALGFTLGDEGAGAELGRRLIKAYFYREMPLDIKRMFDEKYHLDKDSLLENVYLKPLPNRYVASFSSFCGENKTHPFIQKLVKGNLRDFVVRQASKYEGAHNLPIHFVGSVAHFFHDELKEVLAEEGMTLGVVVRSPIHRMAEFHINHES